MKLSWDVSNDGNPPPDLSDGSSQKYRVKAFIGSGGPITEPKRVRPLRVKLQSFKSGSYDIVEERQKTLAPIFKSVSLCSTTVLHSTGAPTDAPTHAPTSLLSR